MFITRAIRVCIGIPAEYEIGLTADSEKIYDDEKSHAAEIVDFLFTTKLKGVELKHALRSKLHVAGWRDTLAQAIYRALEVAVEEGREMTPTLKDGYERAVDAAKAVGMIVEDHPVLCAIVVVGLLAILFPWAIEVLGFAAQGPVPDSFAALWQSRYAGYVPKGSLFSFLQHLGMTLH